MTRAVQQWWLVRGRTTSFARRVGVVRFVVTAVLLAGWLVAGIVATVGSGVDLTCTPADPSVCGPDVGSAWIGLFLAFPVLVWWRPRLGAVAGMVFAVAENLYDTDPAGHLPFAVHGGLCLLGFVVLGGTPRPTDRPNGPARPHRYFDAAEARDLRWVWESRGVLATAATVLLVLAGLGVAVYASDVATEDRHLAVAVRTTAVVTVAVDDDDTTAVTLRLEQPAAAPGATRTLEVFDVGPYPVGDTVPVLVDPGDDRWARLVAEPQDATLWLVAAVFAGALGAAAVVDLATTRRRRHRIV